MSPAPPRRWPLHPRPGALESLSSWLNRLARIYEVPVRELLGPNLGVLVGIPDVLDEDPPPAVFTALAERTGVPAAQVRAMTLPGWVPWLLDAYPLPERDAEDGFYTYVRQYSVLLAPREAPRFEVTHRRRWRGPWIPGRPLRRSCPRCAAGPDPARALIWQLPLTVSCLEHRCRLVLDTDTLAAEIAGQPYQPVPVGEAVAALDGYTRQALIDATVRLPGRTIHAGVWFRLLRCLLDELSLAGSTVTRASQRLLEQIWDATGEPVRAGLAFWQPYENLEWSTQEKLLTAAATALMLAADRRIQPRGTLAWLLTEPQPVPVYDGDPPRPPTPDPPARPRRDLMQTMDAWYARACIDADAARSMLRLLTALDSKPAHATRHRDVLIGEGIPVRFLREDLLLCPGRRTPDETETLLVAEGFDRGDVARELACCVAEAKALWDVPDEGVLIDEDELGQIRTRLEL
ncbi:TniQ family protein [Nocardia farcinica]|uniref:TniQ family protein n=1 Tax=Nocardia farcinica TaxID=37329 RepID=UPI001893960B|nr:TniQ family protein [Nocardia farcinica]MBF6234848.1 TniQ family protein [Nocardia farcinica]MBF6257204.1 TniQ family protein [Nocardia farcinica]MBF6265555.1 TniQ family protein [Nocardia farcinica]MBF6271276.1 TniQ family protein [Nocardia farcinica]MBF6422759.1 TniQ family protein [Nocardia farcinica]